MGGKNAAAYRRGYNYKLCLVEKLHILEDTE